MGFTHHAVNAFGNVIEDVRAGAGKLASRRLATGMGRQIKVTSTAFVAGRLPASSTADGGGMAPEIEWSDVPAATKSFVVLCEDPDTRLPEPFVHWLVYGIPAETRSLDARTSARCTSGRNSRLSTGFVGAAPPPGHGIHHYHFQVFALDTSMDLEPALGRGVLVERMEDHVIAWGEIIGTYERT